MSTYDGGLALDHIIDFSPHCNTVLDANNLKGKFSFSAQGVRGFMPYSLAKLLLGQ